MVTEHCADLHEALSLAGITNDVVDSSSSEGNHCQCRAKSDGLDVCKLVSMLMR
jgi:hypothetical protein